MGTQFTIAAYGRDPKFLAETVEQAFEKSIASTRR